MVISEGILLYHFPNLFFRNLYISLTSAIVNGQNIYRSSVFGYALRRGI